MTADNKCDSHFTRFASKLITKTRTRAYD